MLRIRLTAVLVVVAGLSSSVQAGSDPFHITEVIPNPTSGDVIVEVTNTGAAAADVAGYNLCWQFTYFALPSTVLPAGGSLRAHVGVTGTDTASDVFLGLAMPALGTAADSVSLYLPGAGFLFFANANNLIDFVQYGLGNLPRSDLAAANGQWPDATAFVGAPAAGQSLAWDGDGEQLADWFHDASPTLGAPNLTAGAAALSVGPGCSAATAPSLVAGSAPALGNVDLTLDLSSSQANKQGLLFVGLGTISVPVFGGLCSFYVNSVPVDLEIPVATNAAGAFTLPIFVDDAAFIGVELGLQVILDNDVNQPKFDLSNGLSLTF